MNTIYVVAVGALLSIGIFVGASVQGLRLDAVRSELSSVQSDLEAARTILDRVSRERATIERVLSSERDRAVTAEMEASSLREHIARDAGTKRDGETAPVLRETLERLRGSGLGSGGQSPASARKSSSVSDLGGRFHP